MRAWCRHCRREQQVPFRNDQTPGCEICGYPLGALPKASGPISPASPAQRRKVRGMDCVICGAGASSYVAIDPSHLTPRRRGGCDHPDCVLPMCRHLGDPSGCHELYERGELDLLSIVISESWPAYRSEVQHVLEHLTPVEMVEQLAGARTQWSDMSGGAA